MRRAVALGALVGLAVALAFNLAMPDRPVRTVAIPTRHGERVAVYGALQPYAPRALSRVTVQRSPRTLRDALLGLLAGGLVAGALVVVLRPPPARRGADLARGAADLPRRD
ncbi:MAG: hypothetical protein KGL16_13140 [Acidobacteriota bacterium]|nr:hypothetical protein [Acidobacteriota bacterium]